MGSAAAAVKASPETDKGPEGDRGLCRGCAEKPHRREGLSRVPRPPATFVAVDLFPGDLLSGGRDAGGAAIHCWHPHSFFLMWPASYARRPRRRSPESIRLAHPDVIKDKLTGYFPQAGERRRVRSAVRARWESGGFREVARRNRGAGLGSATSRKPPDSVSIIATIYCGRVGLGIHSLNLIFRIV